MKEKIKNYFTTPLTKGWLWKWTIISMILSGIVSAITLNKIGLLDITQLFKPSDDWEDIPESKD